MVQDLCSSTFSSWTPITSKYPSPPHTLDYPSLQSCSLSMAVTSSSLIPFHRQSSSHAQTILPCILHAPHLCNTQDFPIAAQASQCQDVPQPTPYIRFPPPPITTSQSLMHLPPSHSHLHTPRRPKSRIRFTSLHPGSASSSAPTLPTDTSLFPLHPQIHFSTYVSLFSLVKHTPIPNPPTSHPPTPIFSSIFHKVLAPPIIAGFLRLFLSSPPSPSLLCPFLLKLISPLHLYLPSHLSKILYPSFPLFFSRSFFFDIVLQCLI